MEGSNKELNINNGEMIEVSQSSSSLTLSNPVELPITKVSKRHYISLFLFTMKVCMSILSQYIIMAQYIYYRFAVELHLPDGGLNRNDSSCQVMNVSSDPYAEIRNHVQEKTSQFNMVSSFVTGLPAIFSTIVLGVYSDRMGRKWSVFIGWAGLGASYSIWALWMHFNLPMWVYLVGGLPSAFTGGLGFLLASLFSIVSDTTSGTERSFGIAILDACFGISGLVSMMLTGYLIRWFGFHLSFYGVALFQLTSGVYLIALQETSLAVVQRRQIVKDFQGCDRSSDETISNVKPNKNPCSMFQMSVQVFSMNKQRGVFLGLLLASTFLLAWGYFGNINVSTLYELNKPLCWDSVQISNFSAIKITLTRILALLLIGLCGKYIHDYVLVVAGFLSLFCQAVIVAIVPALEQPLANIVMYSSVAVGVLGGLCLPLLRSILSKLVTQYEQGVIFGVVGSLESLANMLGNMATSGIYEATVSSLPGLAYIVDGGFVAFGLAVFGIYACLKRRSDRYVKSELETPLICD